MNIFAKICDITGLNQVLAKVIALLLIVIASYVAYYVFSHHFIDIGRAEVQKEFDKFKTDSEKEVNRLKSINEADRRVAAEEQKGIKLKYERQIKSMNLDRDKIIGDLKNEINRTGSLLNDVRVLQRRTFGANSEGVPSDVRSAELHPTSGGECDRTIATLTRAGQSCALDFNALREWVDTERRAINGTKKSETHESTE